MTSRRYLLATVGMFACAPIGAGGPASGPADTVVYRNELPNGGRVEFVRQAARPMAELRGMLSEKTARLGTSYFILRAEFVNGALRVPCGIFFFYPFDEDRPNAPTLEILDVLAEDGTVTFTFGYSGMLGVGQVNLLHLDPARRTSLRGWTEFAALLPFTREQVSAALSRGDDGALQVEVTDRRGAPPQPARRFRQTADGFSFVRVRE